MKFVVVTLLLLLAFLAFSARAATDEKAPMTQSGAEGMAGRWWSACYRGYLKEGGPFGAAWWDGESYRVGICDGFVDRPGYVRRVGGGPGAWFNRSWEAEYKATDGRYYKNAQWFGYGKTWELAFDRALSGGYAPVTGGEVDRDEMTRFLKRIGK